jgi:hypothetical protein
MCKTGKRSALGGPVDAINLKPHTEPISQSSPLNVEAPFFQGMGHVQWDKTKKIRDEWKVFPPSQ